MLRQFKNYLFGKLSGVPTEFYNGTGAFSVPAGSGGGGLVLLDTLVASASASLDFISLISSTYNVYEFEFDSIVPGTTDNDFELFFSDDNGATWIAADYYYSWLYSNNVGGSGIQAAGPVNRGLICNNVRDTDDFGVNGWLKVYNPLGNQPRKGFIHQVTAPLVGDQRHFNGGAININAAVANPIDAIRFKFTTGNIASGSISMYGKAK